MNKVFKNVTALTLCALSVAASNVQAQEWVIVKAEQCVRNMLKEPWRASTHFKTHTNYGSNPLAKSELVGPLQRFAGKLQSIKIKAGQKYDAQPAVKALHEFLTKLKTLPVGNKKDKGSVLVTEEERISFHNKIVILYNEKNDALKKNSSGKQRRVQPIQVLKKNSSQTSTKKTRKQTWREWIGFKNKK